MWNCLWPLTLCLSHESVMWVYAMWYTCIARLVHQAFLRRWNIPNLIEYLLLYVACPQRLQHGGFPLSPALSHSLSKSMSPLFLPHIPPSHPVPSSLTLLGFWKKEMGRERRRDGKRERERENTVNNWLTGRTKTEGVEMEKGLRGGIPPKFLLLLGKMCVKDSLGTPVRTWRWTSLNSLKWLFFHRLLSSSPFLHML